MVRGKKGEPREIIQGVYQVSGPDMTDMRDCASYLLDLGELILIDSGSGMAFDRVVQNIKTLGYKPGDITTVILTHCHFDHLGGAVKFREQFGSRLVMHEYDARIVKAGDQRLTAAFCFNTFLPPFSVDVTLKEDNEVLQVGDFEIVCLHTPGHTPGSISAYVDINGTRILFAQDIGAPLLEEFDCDPDGWLKSIEKLSALKADILCDGHSGAYQPDSRVRKYLRYCVNSQYRQGYLIDGYRQISLTEGIP
ncbi:MAG: Zn-dependent hydrolase [Syntrophus sp. (in: bacteria)]|nr:Zn-dependent hydrolase [Syntrophus sp. (in: bacteria)]